MTEPKVLSLSPAVCYKDPKAAVQWLQDAFGFEIGILLTDEAGDIAHCEMRAGELGVGVMSEWATHKSAPSLGGGLDEHCERARAAGARIIEEPAEQFYGDGAYRCADPEGNVWRFSQKTREVSIEEMERVSGLKVRM